MSQLLPPNLDRGRIRLNEHQAQLAYAVLYRARWQALGSLKEAKENELPDLDQRRITANTLNQLVTKIYDLMEEKGWHIPEKELINL